MNRALALLCVATLVGCSTAGIPREALVTRMLEGHSTGICSAHSIPMKKVGARIVYGLVYGPFGHAADARLAKFPFAFRSPMGGCEIPLEGPYFTEIYVCGQCDEAKLKWCLRNPSDPWAKTWLEEMPNKSPEPTTTAVMPAAEAAVPPAAVVAHL